MIDGPHSFTEPSASEPQSPPLERVMHCPLGRGSRLTVINRNAMLVECVLIEKGPCAQALWFGGGAYCRHFLRERVTGTTYT